MTLREAVVRFQLFIAFITPSSPLISIPRNYTPKEIHQEGFATAMQRRENMLFPDLLRFHL